MTHSLSTIAAERSTKDGPLEAKVIPSIVGARGTRLKADDPACLCRCGTSLNKPFCDGMQAKVEFGGET